MIWKYTVFGIPRTKKNSSELVKGPWGGLRPLPSRAWREWCRTARVVWDRRNPPAAIRVPVNCSAVFYRDRRVGDAIGYFQGLADLLEKHGVVADDKFIVSWDGSRLDHDKADPRVEVELEEVG